MNVISDLTRSYPNTAPQVLERVLRNANVADLSMTVMLYEDQLAEFQMAGVELDAWTTRTLTRTTAVADVARELAIDAAATADLTVVFSHHPQVIELWQHFDAETRKKLYFSSWGKASAYFMNAASQATPTLWTQTPLGAVVPDSEAFELLQNVLREVKATTQSDAVRQSTIRPRLARREPNKFGATNPATNTPNYITKLLQRARSAGLVDIVPHPSNPGVWLRDQPSISSADAAGAPRAVGNDVLQAPVEVAAAAGAVPDGLRPEEHYSAVLCRVNMGPFANLRDDLYAALEENAQKKKPLDSLINECLRSAEEAHAAAKGKPIPWRTSVRGFFKKLLIKAAVLRDAENKEVIPSFQTGATPIHGISAGFRTELDGQLILALLEEGVQITYDDGSSLVGALYKSREVEYHERLSAVLAHLRTTGAIQYVGDELKLTPKEPGNVTALPRRG
jgi:hypothetical protein